MFFWLKHIRSIDLRKPHVRKNMFRMRSLVLVRHFQKQNVGGKGNNRMDGKGMNSNTEKKEVVATQRCFDIFTPQIGEDEPSLTHIFQMG